MLSILFECDEVRDFDRASRLEWLESNGLGGWASGTVSGAHTRRYHGLLVCATHPAIRRQVLLSKLDESIVSGSDHYELGCNQYPGAVHPAGYRYLLSFRKEFFPRFEYQAAGIRVAKTVASVYGENTTLVLYEVLNSPAPFQLDLLPLIAGRDSHSLTHVNPHIEERAGFEDGLFRYKPYPDLPELFILAPGAVYYDHIDWYYNFEYAREQSRGLDFQEDLYTPGYFRVSLREGATLGIIISTSDPSGREACELLAREKARRERLLRDLPDREDDLLQSLALAADQFIILRSSAKKAAEFAGPSIIAGYHWFSDRGRDAMIALPGLCLATRRFKEAKEILHYFSLHVSRGMLPDYFHERGQFNEQEQFSEQGQFAEQGREPEYSTADASLWFIVSAFAYFLESGDEGFVRKDLMPVLLDIIQWYLKGTRCGIKTDRDGLLHVGPRQAGEKRAALTWMDARIGDWIFTPRTGKPVEINALWYNAVRISAELCRRFGRSSEQEAMNRLADRVKKSFQARFWYPEGGYLYDVIDGEGEQQEESLKPNQIFALSLPYPLLSGDKARQIVEIVRQQLVTPRGLRSLAPWDSTYRPLYVGDAFDRDSAYHQGTVWAWFLGPWIRALMRFGGPGAEEEARILVNNFVPHLKEAGLGSVSEIFDAEPPHRARGAIAQAWSVAELLRAVLELQGHSVLSVHGKETGFGSAYSSAQ